MGYRAQELVRNLPTDIKSSLTQSSLRLLDHLAYRANEKDAEESGVYAAFPSEGAILAGVGFSRPTLYRSLDELEFTCGFYLITRRECKDRRSALYDLHIQPANFEPDAILARRQSAVARESKSRGRKGVRKREIADSSSGEITSQNETYSLRSTSQNETNHVSKGDVITSQNETQTAKITSQNETYNREYRKNRESEQGKEQGGERPPVLKNADRESKTGTRKPPLPAAIRAVVDKHAEMWTAAVAYSSGAQLPDKFAGEQNLIYGGICHVGGWVRLEGFRERPRDSSFARTDFLEYMQNYDPAYERAVQSIVDSLAEAPPKGKTQTATRAP